MSPASVPVFAAAALAPAAATAAVFSPALFIAPDAQMSGALLNGWLLLQLCAPPLTAFVFNRLQPVATDRDRALWVALPQIAVCVALVRLDTWLEVRSGDLLRGSGEEAMAYGIGFYLSVLAGLVLVVLTAAAARGGAHRAIRARTLKHAA